MLALTKTTLPEGLIDATVKAAMLLAARDAGDAGLVSAAAVALTEGVLHTMFVSKLKMTIAIVLAVGSISSGAGLYAYQPVASRKGSVELKPPAAEADNQNVKELDAFAARLEQLVRNTRQAQAQGEWDQAVAYLGKSTLVVVNWQQALLVRRSGVKADLPPLPTAVARRRRRQPSRRRRPQPSRTTRAAHSQHAAGAAAADRRSRRPKPTRRRHRPQPCRHPSSRWRR